MDYLATIRDGSTGELVNGYWLVELYASLSRKNPVPILLEPFSHEWGLDETGSRVRYHFEVLFLGYRGISFKVQIHELTDVDVCMRLGKQTQYGEPIFKISVLPKCPGYRSQTH